MVSTIKSIKAKKRFYWMFVISLFTAFIIAGCGSDNTTNNETASPSAVISSPAPLSEFIIGEEIVFSADISDSDSDLEDLDIEWTSNLVGFLDESFLASTGDAEFTKSDLTLGEHLIIIGVTDPDGNAGADSVTIYVVLPTAIMLY